MTLSAEFVALQEALIGRYSLERELGRGGMGIVYLARDVRLDRPVAIKILHASLAADPTSRERFIREARIAARLAHPHIVPIYAIESHAGHIALVMEYVHGESLGARLRRRGAMHPDDAERVLREVTWALGYAHAGGVVHRDITLDNILIEQHTGRALLADFGLAVESTGDDGAPRFGTPGYLAPEVIRGEPATSAADFYALGVVSWTALTGQPPFEGDTPAQLLARHLVHTPPPLGSLVRGASPRLVTAIESCLHKAPEQRPASANVLLAMLDRAPEPVAIAPALHEWFTRFERIRPIYAIATPLVAIPVWGLIWQSLSIGGPGWSALTVGPIMALLLTPIFIQLVAEWAALRRLHESGFGIEDIRSAYPHWTQQLERAWRRDDLPPLAGRVVLDLTVIGLFIVAVIPAFYSELPNAYRNDPGVAQYFQTTLVKLINYITGSTMIGVCIGFISPGFRLAPRGIFRRMIEAQWRSPRAALFARAAVKGQKHQLAATTTLHRNTELVLGLAVDDLWRAIPASLREGLGDVPALAHTLQRTGTELRRLAEQLRTSESTLLSDGSHDAALVATRAQVEQRHRETVATLERLRLQLLRLVATRQHTSELTQQIEVARDLEANLLRELAGHHETRRTLRRPVRRDAVTTPSPTPTPA